MVSSSASDRPVVADASLVLVTLIWGTTFVVVKIAVETVDPFVFIALRFGLAALVLGALFWRRVAAVGGLAWRGGLLLGVALFAGFAFQTLGLRETSPARAAFITGLSVVFVPMLSALLLRRRPARAAAAGVALSTLGLAVLSAPLTAEELRMGNWRGDALVLLCAVAFALHIVGVGRYAALASPAAITTIQVVATAALAGGAALVFGAPAPPASVWLAVAYMGAVATALVFLLQNWAQQHTSPTHTALIFALEPVFAALFSALLYGEAITPRAAVGGGLILGGMLVAELRR